ncbi:MAG: SusC/RagA family TonB-linked outer membrane protein [Algibacter sp.]
MLFLFMCSYTLIAQSKTVTGTVTDETNNVPLPGVSVIIEGTSNGAQTDFDGNYSIEASTGDVLKFSFVGMKTITATIGESNVINISLKEDIESLDAVVVTALGIKRQKKSLTYATQNVSSEEISKARPVSVTEGLSGKVAGISVARSGGGVGSDTRVILRGNRSINGDSQPLYVIDGVITQGGINDISPDDIESISVLKGANAAALYGSSAGNGAIVINTKTGKSYGKDFSVTLSSTVTTEKANILIDYQNEFGQGLGGVYSRISTDSWGASLDGSLIDRWTLDPNAPTSQVAYTAQPNNVEDFYQTGINISNNIAIATSNEKSSTYFSYTNTEASGIIEGNELTQHNFNVRINSNVTDKFSVDGKINYIRGIIDNATPQTGEEFTNPNRHILRIPRNIRTQDLEIFEYLDTEGALRQNYFDPGNNGGANPYFSANRNTSETVSDRILAAASLKYQLTDNLSVLGRASLDRTVTNFEERTANDTYIIADDGNYSVTNTFLQNFNVDALLTYTKELNDDWKFNVNVGVQHIEGQFKEVATSNGGLNVPNIFSLDNASGLSGTTVFEPTETNSVYGFGQIAYKNAIFLDITGRNDWNSTLPESNWSFFYPSVSLAAVVSDLVTLPDFVSFLKLRGSFAEVGNGTAPFQLSRAVNIGPGGTNGVLTVDPTSPNPDLRPEQNSSTELGFDLRLFDSRVGIDFTYYKSNVTDQLFQVAVPVASGAESVFKNGGDIQNKGVEIALNLIPVKTEDFSWNIDLNFAKNDSEIVSLTDTEAGESIIIEDDFLRQFRLEVGEEFGAIYSRGFVRDDNGNVIVSDTGLPLITDGFDVNVANFTPDWLGGVRNTFKYKNFNMSFLIDIRQGGSVVSATQAQLTSDGLTTETLIGRDGTAVFGQDLYGEFTAVKEDGTPNDIQINSQDLFKAIGGRNTPVGEAFVRDASNVRLRELIFGYSLPNKILDKLPFEKVNFSLVGRNLFFFSNKAGDFDPEIATSTSASGAGFESFAPPTTRTFGFNIKIGF